MAKISKSLMAFASLMIVLFILMIITAVVYLGGNELKETACEYDEDLGYHWSGSQCQVSSTNTTAVTVEAVTKIGEVQNKNGTLLSLLSLMIVVGIFALVVVEGKSMFKGFSGGKGDF